MRSHSRRGLSSVAPADRISSQAKKAEGSRGLLYRQPPRKNVSRCATVVVSLEGSSKRVSFEQRPEGGGEAKREKSSMVIRLPAKSERMASKGTQTDYRESEVQTLAWKHEVKAEGSILQQLVSLDWLSSEKHFPVGMDEVKLIEATRQRLAWENVMKKLRGAENEGKRQLLVLKMAAVEAEMKESKKEEEIDERIDLSKRRLKEAREAFEENLRSRLLRSYGCRRVENDSKIDYCHHQLTRRIRKMKSARSRPPTRRDIVAIHKDKASDLYAPKLRDGHNPSLAHEIIQIQCRYLKRFHGLEILERHLRDLPLPKPPKYRLDGQLAEPRGPELCPRKFRERVIPKPSELKFEGLSVKVPVEEPRRGHETPAVTQPLSDAEEKLQQACLLLKRLIRGRSVQTDKFAVLMRMKST